MTAKTKTTRAKRAPAAGEGAKSGPRVIRKYPNRRLYDTVESRYVTLADVRRLVVERVDFVVLDRKTQTGHHAQHPAAGDRRAGRGRRVADEP